MNLTAIRFALDDLDGKHDGTSNGGPARLLDDGDPLPPDFMADVRRELARMYANALYQSAAEMVEAIA